MTLDSRMVRCGVVRDLEVGQLRRRLEPAQISARVLVSSEPPAGPPLPP